MYPTPLNLFTTLLFLTSSLVALTQAAFTVPITSRNDTSAIEPNDAGTFCFYPAPRTERTLLPGADCTGPAADFRAVLRTHLAQNASIGYYAADLARLGGAEYIVGGSTGKIYLCVSGQATDGLYETACEVAERDNQFGVGEHGNRTVCSVEAGQREVADGCYAAQVDEPGDSSAVALSGRSALLLTPFALYTLIGHLL